MIALNVDYKNKNEINIDFVNVKKNTIDNLYSHYRDVIGDLSLELSKEMSNNVGYFDLDVVDNIVHTLKIASDQANNLLAEIEECKSVVEIIDALNKSDFEGDDAMIFFIMFDTPTVVI